MRAGTVGLVLSVAVLLPNVGTAQPTVTAQSAEWQLRNEPIVVNGLVYYPTRETRFFDRQIMTQTGVYQSVPVYADVTLEPHSVIYVPVSRMLMRGYERRREGELAGTEGSRVPAFPVDIASGASDREERLITMPGMTTPGLTIPVPTIPATVGTAGSLAAAAPRDVSRPARTYVESIPLPRTNQGIWLVYAGERWYSDGPAVVFDDKRFVQVGEYRGFPVYRDRERGAEAIWVRVVADGPVAPYTKR